MIIHAYSVGNRLALIMLNVYIQCRGATVKIPIPDTCTLTLFLYEIFRETPNKLSIFAISLITSSF